VWALVGHGAGRRAEKEEEVGGLAA